MLKNSIEYIAKRKQHIAPLVHPTLPSYVSATMVTEFNKYLDKLSTTIALFNPDAISTKFGFDSALSGGKDDFVITDTDKQVMGTRNAVGLVVDTTSLIKDLNELQLKGNTHLLDSKTKSLLDALLTRAKALNFEVSYAAVTKTQNKYDQSALSSAS